MSGIVEFLPLYNSPSFQNNWEQYNKDYNAWKAKAKWRYDDRTGAWRKVGAWKVLEKNSQGYNVIFDGDKKFIDYYGAYDVNTYETQRQQQSRRYYQDLGPVQIAVDVYGNLQTATETSFGGVPAQTITLTKRKRDTKLNDMSAEILRSPPIRVKHNSKGLRKTPFSANCHLTSCRTYEITSNVGRIGYTHTDYNTKDELENFRTYANNNLVVQTGIGPKTTLTDGVSTAIPAGFFPNQMNTYIMKQTRTYDVSNFGSGSIRVGFRVFTSRHEEATRLQEAMDDVNFEATQLTGNSLITWKDGVTNQGSDTHDMSSTYPADIIGFDPFKHRYKVRRTFKPIGVRQIILHPGCSVRFVMIDQGPHLISNTLLKEANATCIPGYYRVVRIEINGVDIVANNTAANTQVSKNAGVATVIETMHLSLRASLAMRTLSKTINYTLTQSTPSENTLGPDGYGLLPSFTATLASKINTLTEAISTGTGDAR